MMTSSMQLPVKAAYTRGSTHLWMGPTTKEVTRRSTKWKAGLSSSITICCHEVLMTALTQGYEMMKRIIGGSCSRLVSLYLIMREGTIFGIIR